MTKKIASAKNSLTHNSIQPKFKTAQLYTVNLKVNTSAFKMDYNYQLFCDASTQKILQEFSDTVKHEIHARVDQTIINPLTGQTMNDAVLDLLKRWQNLVGYCTANYARQKTKNSQKEKRKIKIHYMFLQKLISSLRKQAIPMQNTMDIRELLHKDFNNNSMQNTIDTTMVLQDVESSPASILMKFDGCAAYLQDVIQRTEGMRHGWTHFISNQDSAPHYEKLF